jgi:hypothetical protein
MKKPTYLSWQNFAMNIIVEGEQRSHKVSDVPRVYFFWDGQKRRLGAWFETAPDTSLPPELLKLSELNVDVLEVRGRLSLEVAITSKLMRRQFYHFIVAVAERMLSFGIPALEATVAELHCFTGLLAERALLGAERQIGLLGELLFLERLVASQGVEMLDSWVGPDAEPHDFRVDRVEFEVKTTVAPKRIHIIHGQEQLVPSKGCSLLILSLLLGPPGKSSGFSLASKIHEIDGRFAGDPTRKARFVKSLEKLGVKGEDLAHYGRGFSLRRTMAIVPVDNNFPVISRTSLQNILGDLSQRIESLQYAVNLEGLEKEDGDPEFLAVVPS